MGCGERRKCKCCRELFRPDLGNRTHRYYQLGVGLVLRPARLRAMRAGSPSPRTEITSAAPSSRIAVWWGCRYNMMTTPIRPANDIRGDDCHDGARHASLNAPQIGPEGERPARGRCVAPLVQRRKVDKAMFRTSAGLRAAWGRWKMLSRPKSRLPERSPRCARPPLSWQYLS
jgi:hypothetical protein